MARGLTLVKISILVTTVSCQALDLLYVVKDFINIPFGFSAMFLAHEVLNFFKQHPLLNHFMDFEQLSRNDP